MKLLACVKKAKLGKLLIEGILHMEENVLLIPVVGLFLKAIL